MKNSADQWECGFWQCPAKTGFVQSNPWMAGHFARSFRAKIPARTGISVWQNIFTRNFRSRVLQPMKPQFPQPQFAYHCAPVISQVSQLNLGRCLMGFFSPFPVFNGLQSLWNEPTSCIRSKIPKSCQACGWWWYVE